LFFNYGTFTPELGFLGLYGFNGIKNVYPRAPNFMGRDFHSTLLNRLIGALNHHLHLSHARYVKIVLNSFFELLSEPIFGYFRSLDNQAPKRDRN